MTKITEEMTARAPKIKACCITEIEAFLARGEAAGKPAAALAMFRRILDWTAEKTDVMFWCGNGIQFDRSLDKAPASDAGICQFLQKRMVEMRAAGIAI